MTRTSCIRERNSGRLLLNSVAIVPAYSFRAMRGLIGRDLIAADEGLLLHDALGCIHTFGMRCAIDIIMLSRSLVIIKIAERIPPRRVVWRPGATVQLELRAGRATELGLVVGLRLMLADARQTQRGGQDSDQSPQISERSGGRAHNHAGSPCSSVTAVRSVRPSPHQEAPLRWSDRAPRPADQSRRS